jgi:hypothetical protein
MITHVYLNKNVNSTLIINYGIFQSFILKYSVVNASTGREVFIWCTQSENNLLMKRKHNTDTNDDLKLTENMEYKSSIIRRCVYSLLTETQNNK